MRTLGKFIVGFIVNLFASMKGKILVQITELEYEYLISATE